MRGILQDTPIQTRKQQKIPIYSSTTEIEMQDKIEGSKDIRLSQSTSISPSAIRFQNEFSHLNSKDDDINDKFEDKNIDENDISAVDTVDRTELYHDVLSETPILAKRGYPSFLSSFSDGNQSFTSAVSTPKNKTRTSDGDISQSSDSKSVFNQSMSHSRTNMNMDRIYQDENFFSPPSSHDALADNRSSQSFHMPFSSVIKKKGFSTGNDVTLSAKTIRGNFLDTSNDLFPIDFSENPVGHLPTRRKVRFSEG